MIFSDAGGPREQHTPAQPSEGTGEHGQDQKRQDGLEEDCGHGVLSMLTRHGSRTSAGEPVRVSCRPTRRLPPSPNASKRPVSGRLRNTKTFMRPWIDHPVAWCNRRQRDYRHSRRGRRMEPTAGGRRHIGERRRGHLRPSRIAGRGTRRRNGTAPRWTLLVPHIAGNGRRAVFGSEVPSCRIREQAARGRAYSPESPPMRGQ